MKNVLFVTKDPGPCKAMLPIAEALRSQGETRICVVAEGLSVANWAEAGFEIDVKGSIDFRSEPDVIDSYEVLERLHPDAVVIGSGAPINLEAKFVDVARAMEIPQVWVENVWGVSGRLPGRGPELVVTLDPAGEALLRRQSRFGGSRILLAGNPAVTEFSVPDDVVGLTDKLRKECGTLVLFCGQSWDTPDLLALLFTSLLDGAGVVIPRWHPKRLSEDGNAVLWPAMMRMYERAGGRVLNLDHVKSTDALAATCDIVVSGTGTALLYAAKFGRVPLSITTAVTKAALRDHDVGYDRWPGLDSEIGIELTGPVPDLFAYVRDRQAGLAEKQRRYFSQPTLSPREIAGEILKLAH